MIREGPIGGYDRGHKTAHFTTDASMPHGIVTRPCNPLEQHQYRETMIHVELVYYQ
jgi:hypothetical protein